MRSPHRIKPFLAALEVYWMTRPDERFGQLIMNLSRTPDGFADIWEWDCSAFTKQMVSYRNVCEIPVTETSADDTQPGLETA